MKAVFLAGYYGFNANISFMHVSSNQESLCSSNISMFWAVL